MRPSERSPDMLRAVTLETGVNRYAEGSCLVSFGHTKVLVTASVDEGVPPNTACCPAPPTRVAAARRPRANNLAERRKSSV
jgi:ribonuclease PH